MAASFNVQDPLYSHFKQQKSKLWSSSIAKGKGKSRREEEKFAQSALLPFFPKDDITETTEYMTTSRKATNEFDDSSNLTKWEKNAFIKCCWLPEGTTESTEKVEIQPIILTDIVTDSRKQDGVKEPLSHPII